jgi:hypothetical protein
MRGARRTGKTTLAEMVGREHAGERFVKLDFQTDIARCDAIFSGATDDLDRITANIAPVSAVRPRPRTIDSLLR